MANHTRDLDSHIQLNETTMALEPDAMVSFASINNFWYCFVLLIEAQNSN
jgi:hypothetical protein